MKTNRIALAAVLLILSLNAAFGQSRHWKALQVGFGVNRSQVFNDTFHSLTERGSIAPQHYGFQFAASYMINPFVVRAKFFTEEFTLSDQSYLYGDKPLELRGYDGSLGLNIVPHSKVVCVVLSAGYKYSMMASTGDSLKVLSSKLLQFPYWNLGLSTSPHHKFSLLFDYGHPFTLSQREFGQFSFSVYYTLNNPK